jgi:hypothetical protein
MSDNEQSDVEKPQNEKNEQPSEEVEPEEPRTVISHQTIV